MRHGTIARVDDGDSLPAYGVLIIFLYMARGEDAGGPAGCDDGDKGEKRQDRSQHGVNAGFQSVRRVAEDEMEGHVADREDQSKAKNGDKRHSENDQDPTSHRTCMGNDACGGTASPSPLLECDYSAGGRGRQVTLAMPLRWTESKNVASRLTSPRVV